MAGATYLARPNELDEINIGAPFKPATELLEKFMDNEDQTLACGSRMVHHRIDESEIDLRFGVINAGDVIDLVMLAKGSLQVT